MENEIPEEVVFTKGENDLIEKKEKELIRPKFSAKHVLAVCEFITKQFDFSKEVLEIRLLRPFGAKKSGSIRGFFDDISLIPSALEPYNTIYNCYFGINPRRKDITTRLNVIEYGEVYCDWLIGVNNTDGKQSKKWAGCDEHVTRTTMFVIDLDRAEIDGKKHNNPASDEELNNILALRDKVIEWLKEERKIEDVSFAMSGNGGHILIHATPYDNPKKISDRFKRILKLIGRKFNTDKINIDSSVSTAARIFKMYGTLACKGEETQDRPFRVAEMEYASDTIYDVLDKFPEITEYFEEEKVSKAERKEFAKNLKTDRRSWVDDWHIDDPESIKHFAKTFNYVNNKPDMWIVKCPNEAQHSMKVENESVIFIDPETKKFRFYCQHEHCHCNGRGENGEKCQHESCKNLTIKDYLEGVLTKKTIGDYFFSKYKWEQNKRKIVEEMFGEDDKLNPSLMAEAFIEETKVKELKTVFRMKDILRNYVDDDWSVDFGKDDDELTYRITEWLPKLPINKTGLRSEIRKHIYYLTKETERDFPYIFTNNHLPEGRYIHFNNGLFDFDEMIKGNFKHYDHTPAYVSPYHKLAIDFNESAKKPFPWFELIEAQFKSGMGYQGRNYTEDAQKQQIKALKQWYALQYYYDSNLQFFHTFIGAPGAGKDCHCNIASTILGRKNVTNLPFSVFSKRNFDLSDIITAMSNMGSDNKSDDDKSFYLDTDTLNAWTGGKYMQLSRKYRMSIRALIATRLTFLMNNVFKIRGHIDDGIFRRWLAISFGWPSPFSQTDYLKLNNDILKNHLQGICLETILEYKDIYSSNFPLITSINEDIKKESKESDIVIKFLVEECETMKPELFDTLDNLYEKYVKYSEICGQKQPMFKITFAKLLTSRGFKSERIWKESARGGTKYFGIQWIPEPDKPQKISEDPIREVEFYEN